MRRPLGLAALAALVVTPLVAVVPASGGVSEEWKGRPTLIGGTARYDKGEWIYTDFVYDDYGADTGSWGQPNVVGLAPTAGDARYPDGAQYADNAADIVEVRARAVRNDLQVRVLLETITDPSVVALSVAVGDAPATVFTASNAAVDAAANTVEFVLPGAAGAPTATLTIGAGLHDGNGGLMAGQPGNAYFSPNAYTTGGPTENRLFDLAFNNRDVEGRGGAWNEDAQSAALADGDLSAFSQTIDITKLRDDRSRPMESLAPGYYVRLFPSRLDLGEGVASSFPQYRGRWQPYALWIPDSYDQSKPSPLFLNLHSLSVHHNQYRGGGSGTYDTMYEQMGDGLDAIVVTPLGRGPDGWYIDEALVDTLEVWADVRRHYAVDAERTLVGGYSMGGYGTYRLSTLMPDSFASAVSIVGPPTNGIWAYPFPASGPFFTYPQLESTRHVPFWITHGVADELVPVLGVQAQADRFATLGHEHRFALHPAADHLSFSVHDEWSRETAWFAAHPRRVVDPREVTLKVRPASWVRPEKADALLPLMRGLLGELGARIDGGYWVGDVAVAPGADRTGGVALASDGIARRRSGTTSVLSAGVDGPTPYRLTGTDVAYTDGATADVLRGTLTDVTSLTVDVGRAKLSDSPRVEVTSNLPATITFVRNGAVVGRARVGGLAALP